MNKTNRIGIVTTIITSTVLLAIWGGYVGVKKVLTRQENSANPQTVPEITNQNTDPSSIDTDNDNLPDNFETIYKTDPANPDSDNDGTNDGEEIEQLRDPTVAAPNDALFPDSITNDLLTADTFTNEYLNSLPKDADRSVVLSSEGISAFVTSHQDEFLPKAFAKTATSTNAAGKDAITEYLEAISATHNDKLSFVSSDDIQQAFQQSYGNKDARAIDDIMKKLETNYTTLKSITPPEEAVSLHGELLASSKSLLENVRLLQNVATDFVGALIGAKNIETLSTNFSSIAEQIAALEKKYSIQ